MVNDGIILLRGSRIHRNIISFSYHSSKDIQRALKVLNVKNEPNADAQQQRMLLFMAARRTLNSSMKILGLKPLEKM